MLFAVSKVTTRTLSSEPGWIFVMRPSFHFNSIMLESFINTISPTAKFFLGSIHFGRCCNRVRYSWDHLFQKCWNIFVTICHRVKWLIPSLVRVFWNWIEWSSNDKMSRSENTKIRWHSHQRTRIETSFILGTRVSSFLQSKTKVSNDSLQMVFDRLHWSLP